MSQATTSQTRSPNRRARFNVVDSRRDLPVGHKLADANVSNMQTSAHKRSKRLGRTDTVKAGIAGLSAATAAVERAERKLSAAVAAENALLVRDFDLRAQARKRVRVAEIELKLARAIRAKLRS